MADYRLYVYEHYENGAATGIKGEFTKKQIRFINESYRESGINREWKLVPSTAPNGARKETGEHDNV